MHEIELLSKNVTNLRKAENLTQEQFASMARISVGYCQSIEKGRVMLTIETWRNAARTLGVAPETLGVFHLPDQIILDELRSRPQVDSGGRRLTIFQNSPLLRKKNNWTQYRLSQEAGVSVATVGRFERGIANITIGKLMAIAGAFGISMLTLALLTTPEEEFMEMVRETRRKAEMPIVL